MHMGINESWENIALLRTRDGLNVVDCGVKAEAAVEQTSGGNQLSLKRHGPSLAHLFVCDASVTHGFTNYNHERRQCEKLICPIKVTPHVQD